LGRKRSMFIILLIVIFIIIILSYFFIMFYTQKNTITKVIDTSIKGELIQSLEIMRYDTLKSFWSSVNELTGFNYSIKRIETGWNESVFLVHFEKFIYDQDNNLISIIDGSLSFQLSRTFINNWSITDI
jgi:hypothetical protein